MKSFIRSSLFSELAWQFLRLALEHMTHVSPLLPKTCFLLHQPAMELFQASCFPRTSSSVWCMPWKLAYDSLFNKCPEIWQDIGSQYFRCLEFPKLLPISNWYQYLELSQDKLVPMRGLPFFTCVTKKFSPLLDEISFSSTKTTHLSLFWDGGSTLGFFRGENWPWPLAFALSTLIQHWSIKLSLIFLFCLLHLLKMSSPPLF